LAEHGGAWVELSSSRPPQSLDALFPRKGEFSGWVKDGVIQTDVMACRKGSAFVQAWRDECRELLRFPNEEAYRASRQPTLERLGRGMPPTLPLAAEVVLAYQKYPMDSLILREETRDETQPSQDERVAP